MTVRGYLLDTNIVSEQQRRRPNDGVVDFLDSVRQQPLFLSVLTIGELRKGADARRRADRAHALRLDAWIAGLEETFSDFILPVDIRVARLWGELSATRPRAVVDTLLAATAINWELTLVTRNVRDIEDTGAAYIDPWQ